MNQTEMLKRLEWSGALVKAFDPDPIICCPECGCVPSVGHTKTCELNRLINQPQIDCPMTGEEVREIGEQIHKSHRWVSRQQLNELANWLTGSNNPSLLLSPRRNHENTLTI